MKRYRVLWASFLFFLAMAAVNVTGTDVKAAVTISNTDTSTTKKVHAELMKGKATTLKVKGSKSSSTTKVKAIVGKIKKVNGQGVIFHFKATKKSGKYYLYDVSKENARLYMYSVKFISKLYAKMRSAIYQTPEGADYKKYPDTQTRRLRIAYDTLVRAAIDNKWTGDIVDGYEAATTKTPVEWSAYDEKAIVKSKTSDWSKGTTNYQLYTFKEFVEHNDASSVLKNLEMYEFSDQELLLLNRRFCDLSDAMKVYAIEYSEYFDCNFARPDYGMMYDYKWSKLSGSKGMKALYENKAVGVCEVYAAYEKLVFNQLGMTCYRNSSWKINHAWTVVKVKNSSGKTLWIPFDYGIGPSTGLSVKESQKKYIDTEAKRYKLYLKGIKGAPTKKNFVEADFK